MRILKIILVTVVYLVLVYLIPADFIYQFSLLLVYTLALMLIYKNDVKNKKDTILSENEPFINLNDMICRSNGKVIEEQVTDETYDIGDIRFFDSWRIILR